MGGGIGVDGNHRKPFQVVLVGVVREVNDLANLVISNIPAGVREVAAQVQLDNPCGFREALRDIVDVLYQLVHRGLRPLALAIVEGVPREDGFSRRNHDLADFVVNVPPGEAGSHNLPPSRDGSEEGIVLGNPQSALIPVAETTDEVREPRIFVLHSIPSVPLILPCVKIDTHKISEVFCVFIHSVPVIDISVNSRPPYNDSRY